MLGLTTAGVQQRAVPLDNGLALTPPLGWNGFNYFTRNVTASIAEAEARAIVASGMKAERRSVRAVAAELVLARNTVAAPPAAGTPGNCWSMTAPPAGRACSRNTGPT